MHKEVEVKTKSRFHSMAMCLVIYQLGPLMFLDWVLLTEKFPQRSLAVTMRATFFYTIFLSHTSAGQVMKKTDFQ